MTNGGGSTASKKIMGIWAGIAGVAVVGVVLFLILGNRSGYELDLSAALRHGDLSIDGHPWLSTLTQAQDLLDAGGVQEPNGDELVLRLTPLKVRGVDRAATGLFQYVLIKDEQRLLQLTLEFTFTSEKEYLAFLNTFEGDMTEALEANADLRNEKNTKELDLASFRELDRDASEHWRGAYFRATGGGLGRYTLDLFAYQADPNLRGAYGEDLAVLVLVKLGISRVRKGLGETSEEDLILSLPAFE